MIENRVNFFSSLKAHWLNVVCMVTLMHVKGHIVPVCREHIGSMIEKSIFRTCTVLKLFVSIGGKKGKVEGTKILLLSKNLLHKQDHAKHASKLCT